METAIGNTLQARARMNESGRVVIPVAIRQKLGLSPGDTLLFSVDGDRLVVESYYARIRRLQEEFAKYAKPGILASDELIAERREEFRRDEEELARDLERLEEQTRKAEQIA